MSKKRKKLGEVLEDSGYQKLYIDLTKDNFVLTRKEDNKQMCGSTVKFIEWDENGKGKVLHDTPAVGRSIVLDLTGPFSYQWMTTQITEIISETEFKTLNSTYTLHKV